MLVDQKKSGSELCLPLRISLLSRRPSNRPAAIPRLMH
jgi:hypothetical protein